MQKNKLSDSVGALATALIFGSTKSDVPQRVVAMKPGETKEDAAKRHARVTAMIAASRVNK